MKPVRSLAVLLLACLLGPAADAGPRWLWVYSSSNFQVNGSVDESYTTWRKDYSKLEEFAELVGGGELTGL